MASNGIEVYVKHPSGRNAQYNIPGHKLIKDLCGMVAKEEGLPEEHIRLKYQGKTLDLYKSLTQYGVRTETILKAEILIPADLGLVVELPADDKGEISYEELVISNLKRVGDLYDRVAEILAVPVGKVQLFISGRQLPNSLVLLIDAGISDETKIKAVVVMAMSKTASKTGAAVSAPAEQAEELDDDALQTVMSSFNTQGRNVEVAFSFDTTGSMSSYLERVRTKLKDSVTRLLQEIPGIRISLIAHGDYCDYDNYVLRKVDFTSDVNELVDFANTVPPTGGGDSPECYEWVLKKSQLLDWSEDSAKALVVIGDLYPHPPNYTDQNIRWKDELDLLSGMGVKVYGVQAGTNRPATNFYKELANVSGGCYIKLNNIDAITDMFLAVCYRETHEDKLDDFVQEVETAGGMTEERRELFKQLTEKQTTETTSKQKDDSSVATPGDEEPQRRYPVTELTDDWWTMCDTGGRHQYSYEEQTDKWSSSRSCSTSVSAEFASPPGIRSITLRAKRKKNKGRCVLM